MTLQAEISERISQWRPDTGMKSPTPNWVLFVRESVAAAGPRDHAEARNALRWCAGLVEAAVAAGMPLEASALFGAGSVTAYLETLSVPKGTKAGMSSLLRRLHPDVGCAGTTRVASAAPTDTAVSDTAMHLVERTQVAVSPNVAAEIDRFVPTLLPPELWSRINGVVRSIVRDSAPISPERAVTLVRDVAYLTAWMHTEHRVLVPATILKAASIEAFLDVLVANGRGQRSVASYASNLHAVRDAHGLPLDVVRRHFTKPTAKEPYNAAEIDALYEQAARIPTADRRRHATTCLDLMFGIGAKPTEAGLVRPDDVTKIGAAVAVNVSGQSVEVLPAYADSIAKAAALVRAKGGTFLIGGAATTVGGRSSALFFGKGKRWQVTADSRRARATWLVEIAARLDRAGGLPGLLGAARLTTMQRFDELMDHIAARSLELTDTSFLTLVPPEASSTSEAAS